ncbi:MAG TPA: rhodanese-like domain-containing protein [Gemmatimonadales bacterium]
MLLRRLYEDMLAQASYIIACDETRHAIVVDPNRDVDKYLAVAKADKLKITHVTETHIHADFVSGARALAEATGAKLLLSGEGGEDWQYKYAADADARILHDRDVIDVGTVRVAVIHTPGHTPEHLCFLITDTTSANTPMGLLSGDFIFVGDVGRPDLLERAAGIGDTMEAMARQLYQSLKRSATLPDHLQIWPGHGAGSACGKALGDVPSSTLGYERLVNWAFRATSEEDFLREVLAGQPEPPRYFARMKTVNRDGPKPRIEASRIPRMSPTEFTAAVDAGALVIDVRATAEYAVAHMAGTLNIPTGTSFPNWLGSLVSPEQRIIFLVGRDDSRFHRALRGAALVGMDRVIGWGGPEIIQHWIAANRRLGTTLQLEPKEAEASGRVVIDVRGQSEWDEEHIASARHAFLGDLVELTKDIPKDQPLVLACSGGSRSAIGASLLQANGFTNVANLKGGVDAWKDAGLEVRRD